MSVSWATARSIMILLLGDICLPIVQQFDLCELLPGSPLRRLTSGSLKMSRKVLVLGANSLAHRSLSQFCLLYGQYGLRMS